MKEYNHLKIEKKWQKEWEKKGIFHAEDPAKDGATNSKKPKFYGLIEFPYPSGAGMHVGHIRSNTAMDIISRKRRMEGYNVLYPIGWDAFGLPTENYAIKTGIHPTKVTKDNTDNFRKQLQALGFSFDWSREINTTDPAYYKWTQWIFLQFFKKGLAYKKKMTINWCPKDKIGLANEEVVDGCCERCGTPVEKREKDQWMLAITKYADRLDKDLDTVDYLEKIKIQQRNWIGKSEGVEIDFKLSSTLEEYPKGEVEDSSTPSRKRSTPQEGNIKVFTTRPDTIFGATFLALAPEIAKKITGKDFGIKIETDRENKEKFGVDTGLKATNPANGKEIPIWVVNYVSADYGTGAIMGVPADDERDKEFALKFNLPIVENYKKAGFEDFGKKVVTYKLRDWVFSRQRYWGEPIPLVYCLSKGSPCSGTWVPVPEGDLPVELPKVKNYQPTDSGESPLANIDKWVNVKCPECKGKAKRETDTMPNWAGSSWYYLAYCMNKKGFKGSATIENWKLQIENFGHLMPVDWYNGGMEHTTLHLLYSRFWHKFLYDLKLVPTSEPYMKRTSHGLILAEDGTKFSKSKGNGIDPQDVVKIYGADSLRLYEMFMGPFDQAVSWSNDGMVGPRRFLERVWNLQYKVQENKTYSEFEMEKVIKKVTEDVEVMKFNTAISTLMIFVNEAGKLDALSVEVYEKLLKILSPFAPHITEELWQILGHKNSINSESWPAHDLSKIKDEEIKIILQINGKMRGEMMVAAEENEESIKTKALDNQSIAKHLAGQSPKRVIYVKNRLINIVI